MAKLETTKIYGDLTVTGYIRGKIWPGSSNTASAQTMNIINGDISTIQKLEEEIELSNKLDNSSFISLMESEGNNIEEFHSYRKAIISNFYRLKRNNLTNDSFVVIVRPLWLDKYIY